MILSSCACSILVLCMHGAQVPKPSNTYQPDTIPSFLLCVVFMYMHAHNMLPYMHAPLHMKISKYWHILLKYIMLNADRVVNQVDRAGTFICTTSCRHFGVTIQAWL